MGILLTIFNDREAESEDQDQSARMCSLILLYTLHKTKSKMANDMIRLNLFTIYLLPHSSVGSVADLRTGGRWLDPRPGKYSFRGFMIVIAT